MNSERVQKTAIDASRQKELDEVLSLCDLIAPRRGLKGLYEQGGNEFVNLHICR